MNRSSAPIAGRRARAAAPSAVPSVFLAALCLALASCPDPAGGGGGGGGGGTPVVAKNPDASTWGSWLINGSYEWYLSGSHLIYIQPSGTGSVRWLYKIDKADAASLSVIYERAEAVDGATLPTAAPRDLAFSVARVNADLMRSPVLLPSTASVYGKVYFMIKSAGAAARATGLAATGTPDSRALIPAAGISLTIRNTLNAFDSQTVATTAAGEFPVQNAVPGDSYELSFPGSGKPPIPLAIGYDGEKVGIAADPGAKTYSLKHQGVQGLWDTSSGLRALPYHYIGEEIVGLTTEVRISGTGETGWAQWRFSYAGTPLPWSASSPYRYFELPHAAGTMHDTMATRIPATFVSTAELAAGADYVDREIDLGAWVRSDERTTNYDTRIWQDSLWLRFYASSFQLGAVCDSSSVPKALLTLPDQRSFDFGLEFYTFSTDTRVPSMLGNYYIAVIWSGSNSTESYSFGPGLTFPIDASYTSGLGLPATIVDESAVSINDSKASATKIDAGAIFRGSVSSGDPVDFLYFAVTP